VLVVNYVDKSPGMLGRLNELVEQVNESLAISGIDEVAVLDLRGDESVKLLSFVKHMVALKGVELFNTVSDEVKCFPIPGEYGVHYDFYRTPYDWRLEVMHFTERTGVSPLHRMYWPNHMGSAEMPVVHLSFKCYDERDYFACLERLGADGYVCGQYCESTYGRFSYWMLEEGVLAENQVWLKPRVNLREQRRASAEASRAQVATAVAAAEAALREGSE
jgi:hypothetical protein